MIIWTESFDPFNGSSEAVKKYSLQGSSSRTGGSTSGGGRTGGTSLSGVYDVDLVGTDQNSFLIIGYAFRVFTLGNARIIQLYGDTGTTLHVTVGMDATGKLLVYRGDHAAFGTGTLVASSAAPVFVTSAGGLYYYIEVKIQLSDTVGSVTARVDGTTVITATGLDTKNAGTGTVFDRLRWTGQGDDVYVCNTSGSVNTDFLGPVHIEALRPNSNGATSNGVGSDGNSVDNYLLVDEALSTTQGGWPGDYVDFANTGDKDTYTFTDSTFATTRPVLGVMVWTDAQKSDAGARGIAPIARLSGVESTGSTITLLNSLSHTNGVIFETKPGGGSWTVADVNSAEFGVIAT